jgi:hypothetical protein
MPDSTPKNRIYQAIAVVQGILSLDGPYPILSVDGHSFAAYITKTVRTRHKPGEVQNFKVYPCMRNRRKTFQIINVSNSQPTPLVLKGCWELYLGLPYFIIYRNEEMNLHDRFERNLVPVIWDEAPPPDGQFWEAEAEVRDGEFVITKAEGPFEPPPKARPSALEFSKAEPRPAKHSSAFKAQDEEHTAHLSTLIASIAVPAQTQPVASTSPLTLEEIRAMATPTKISLTCKLNQVPAHRELPNKQVEFYLQDGESDRIFTVQMKPKMFKKLTDHGFADWVAAITGEIGAATETGFELVNAAVQVFEKKPKGESGARGQEEAGEKRSTAEVQPSEKDGVGKRKSLLQGVQMK